jgi:signal transduction histidine kinase
VASLALLGFFIILTVHIYQYKHSGYVLAVLFLILSLIGLATIYRITQSITNLSSQISQISSKNLDRRISLENSDDEIGRLSHSFNNLLDRLDSAFKRERQFIADIAHEMKTPLATLRSSFEVTLHKERINEEYKKIIKDSIAETDRLTATLKDVLDLAWSEAPDENRRVSFNLSELVKELVEIAQKLSLKKQIAVTPQIEDGIIIKGFRERLGRAILNVIDNAIKYGRQNGKINISLVKEHGNVLIDIKDDGQGIERSEIDRIFDRFYRGSKTNKVFGAGLGLAITKATVEIHHGSIRVASKKMFGSIFTIVLPLY